MRRRTSRERGYYGPSDADMALGAAIVMAGALAVVAVAVASCFW